MNNIIKKPLWKRKWFIGLIIFMSLGVVGNFLGHSDSESGIKAKSNHALSKKK